MTVVFLGGPLDGELREVPDQQHRYGRLLNTGLEDGERWSEHDCPDCHFRVFDGTTCGCGLLWSVGEEARGAKPLPAEFSDYHISNGIARHESLSEEEVARRVSAWREQVDALQRDNAALLAAIEEKAVIVHGGVVKVDGPIGYLALHGGTVETGEPKTVTKWRT